MISNSLALLMLVAAIVLFLVAAAYPPPQEPWRSRLAFFGLAFWAFSELLFRGLGKL